MEGVLGQFPAAQTRHKKALVQVFFFFFNLKTSFDVPLFSRLLLPFIPTQQHQQRQQMSEVD